MTVHNNEANKPIEPAYLKNYGLREAPFAALHDNKFVYIDDERAERLNKLQHLCRFSNLLLLVEGTVGIGKSTFVQRFIHAAGPEYKICTVTANTMTDAEQLLFQAAQGFGVRELPQDASDLMGLLYNRVATFHHNGQIPVLIVDDAHQLPKEALLAIYNLADSYVNDVNLLRLILVCEPQIEKILGSKDLRVLRDRVTHTMDLPPLNQQTTAEYMKHRMAVAGFDGGSPFTPQMVKKIYRASRGIPMQINRLAHEALVEGDVLAVTDQDQHQQPDHLNLNKEKKSQPLIYATAAVFLLALVLVFHKQILGVFDEDSQPLSDHSESEYDAISQGQPAGEWRTVKNKDTQLAPGGPELKERIISLSEPAPQGLKAEEQDLDNTEQTASVQGSTKTKITDAVSDTSTALPQSITAIPPPQIDSIQPSQVAASRDRQLISIIGQGFKADSGVIVNWPGHEKKLGKEQIQVVSATQIDINLTVGVNEDNWTVRVVSPESGESNEVDFRVVNASSITEPAGNKWLAAQNPTGYTLQVFSTNKKSSAEQFIKQFDISGNGGYFHSRRNGQDWYSIVHGSYPDRKSAQQAVKSLPDTLKKNRPWIRKFADIQMKTRLSMNSEQGDRSGAEDRSKNIDKPIPLLTSIKGTSQYEAWLWSQDPGKYTLQLLGAQQPGSIESFLRKYKNLNGKAVYFHTRRDTRDWYAVVYGVYPDRQKAQQAIKRLPKELQTSLPWIRSFGSIHAEMDRAR